MRIPVAHIITKLELGGAQQNTLFTVSHLDPVRFIPVLITGEPGILDSEAQALPGVRFHQVPSLVRPINPVSDIRALVGLSCLLRKLKPTIVHTHSSKAGILGRIAAWFAGVPIIIHSVHGFGFTPYQGPVLRRVLIGMERLVGRITTRFFCVSEANRRMGIATGLFREGQCTVIRSGIDLSAIRRLRVDVAVKKQDLGLDLEQPVVGMIAPLKPQKAPFDFIKVAEVVHRLRPDVQFLVVGDGELRGAMETEVDRLGLSDVVRMLGWRRDSAEIMRCLNVFVLTSLWEGLPRVYLEALASGVPVVGTRVDGVSEVVREGINGYLVDPGNVPALADRVLFLLGNPQAAVRMGGAGESLPSEFDIFEMVRRQEKEYDALVSTLQNRSRMEEVHSVSH